MPLQGLRMQAPEKKEDTTPSIQAFQVDPETSTFSRPASTTSTMRRDWEKSMSRREGSTEMQVRQKEQLEQFYSQLDQQKENQLRVDQVERKL